MLSIIISSYKPKLFLDLEKNIAETCGIPYEIIKIDNPGIMGICKAYNAGAIQAKYDNLLFLHEDVSIATKNWGEKLLEYYKIPNLGLLGLAGNIRKFNLPYGFHSGIDRDGRMFVSHLGDKKREILEPSPPYRVKVIDGVFIGIKKSVWSEIMFNEEIKGFHFYDVDISLRTSKNYNNYLVSNLDITHFSKGNFGNDWVHACLRFHKISSKYTFDPIAPKELRDVRRSWYIRLLREHISILNRIRFALKMGVNKDTYKQCFNFILGRSFFS